MAPGQALTFAMRMVAPTRALTDYFSWWLEVSNDAQAGAMLPVIG